MRIMILDDPGAREHALAWALKKDKHDLWIVPGNEGTEALGTNIAMNPEDLDAVVAFAQAQRIELVVVGSEGLLAKGAVDRLSHAGIPAFGPTQAAAQIEASKSFALAVMDQAHIPHPESWVFSNPQAVRAFVKNYGKPVAIKADGLARGKGVWICQIHEEATHAAELCAEQYPGPIIVQELLHGPEVSVFCFTDGYTISSLVAACDYKRRFNGDEGPNTGGMGSYAWPSFWTEELASWVVDYVMKPAIRAMALRGTPFVGVLYAGLMLTKQGRMVLEFNCRLGNPEAAVILPLFTGDLAKTMLSCVRGTLYPKMAAWNMEKSCVGVVIVSEGYPEDPVSNAKVEQLGAMDPAILVFHGGRVGRILTLVGIAPAVPFARALVYSNMSRLLFTSASYRTDIGI